VYPHPYWRAALLLSLLVSTVYLGAALAIAGGIAHLPVACTLVAINVVGSLVIIGDARHQVMRNRKWRLMAMMAGAAPMEPCGACSCCDAPECAKGSCTQWCHCPAEHRSPKVNG
jgi:hypothetical protein